MPLFLARIPCYSVTMALPPPPKYKRFIEEQDSKHVAVQRTKREEARAMAIKKMKEWEAEQERERRRHPTYAGTNGHGIVTLVYPDQSVTYTIYS